MARTGKGKLPTNLYTTEVKGKVYYRYRRPDGKFRGLGTDKNTAVRVAKELNEILVPGTDEELVNVLDGANVNQAVDEFYAEYINDRDLAPATLRGYAAALSDFKARFGDRHLHTVSLYELKNHLQAYPVSNRIMHRSKLKVFYKVAISLGHCKENLPEMLLKPVYKVTRKRITPETFEWLIDHAEPWMVCAILLAVVTLQRVSDLVKIKKSDIKDGRLHVIQTKTQKHDTAYIAIEITPTLQRVIDMCLDLPYEGSYLLRKKPVKVYRNHAKGKRQEPTQILSRKVSEPFTALVDQCPHVAQLPKEERPTFHELRSYGIRLYRNNKLQSQQLAGHASEQQHRNYDSRYEDIRWIETEAALPAGVIFGEDE